jgi:hypothetical protein
VGVWTTSEDGIDDGTKVGSFETPGVLVAGSLTGASLGVSITGVWSAGASIGTLTGGLTGTKTNGTPGAVQPVPTGLWSVGQVQSDRQYAPESQNSFEVTNPSPQCWIAKCRVADLVVEAVVAHPMISRYGPKDAKAGDFAPVATSNDVEGDPSAGIKMPLIALDTSQSATKYPELSERTAALVVVDACRTVSLLAVPAVIVL